MEARVVRLLLLLLLGRDLASADLTPAGPYTLDVLEIDNCDDGEYPGLFLNISLMEDKEAKEVVYSGEATLKYDFLADDFEIQSTHYKWGSTGGWGKIFLLNFTQLYDYLKTNFPHILESLLEIAGIEGKRAIPGTYYVEHLKVRGFTFERVPVLTYGKYKSYFKGLKDGEPVLCMQMICSVNEAPASLGFGFKQPF